MRARWHRPKAGHESFVAVRSGMNEPLDDRLPPTLAAHPALVRLRDSLASDAPEGDEVASATADFLARIEAEPAPR